MIKSEPDLDAFLDAIDCKAGAFRLWVTILWDCVQILKDEKIGSRGLAESFIFDPENFFFEAVCDQMKVDPERFRKRLKEARFCLKNITQKAKEIKK